MRQTHWCKMQKGPYLRMEPCQRFYRQWVAVVLEVVNERFSLFRAIML